MTDICEDCGCGESACTCDENNDGQCNEDVEASDE